MLRRYGGQPERYYAGCVRDVGSAMAPVYNYVAATRPLSDTELASIGWRSRMPFNDSRTLVYYLGLTPDIGFTSEAVQRRMPGMMV